MQLKVVQQSEPNEWYCYSIDFLKINTFYRSKKIRKTRYRCPLVTNAGCIYKVKFEENARFLKTFSEIGEIHNYLFKKEFEKLIAK